MKKTIGFLLALSMILSLCGCRIISFNPNRIPAIMATQAPTEAPTTETTSVATQAPTIAPTAAPTTAPTAPVKTVIDCTYPNERAVVNTHYTHHIIRCPALTADTPDAQAINKKIYDTENDIIKKIENGEADDWVCQFDYQYTDYDGIIALVVDLTVAFIQSDVLPVFHTYYYDSNTGKQLTYEEYLSALEITEAQLLAAYNALETTNGNFEIFNFSITGAAVGKDDTHIVVSYQTEFDGVQRIATVKTSTLK